MSRREGLNSNKVFLLSQKVTGTDRSIDEPRDQSRTVTNTGIPDQMLESISRTNVAPFVAWTQQIL